MNSRNQEELLQRDVEDLRQRFSKTQELYREVCALLFFRYGITPTANRLYQLVRKGSMSAPAEALAQFWSDLREKSRTRIEHPDLPESLGALGGEVLAQLWMAARREAEASLEIHRQEATQAVVQAREEVALAHRAQEEQQELVRQMQSALAASQEQIAVLREHIVALESARQALAANLADEKKEKAALQDQLESHRREFSAELDGLRTAMQMTEERTRATEKRLLLELDRERMASASWRKELDGLRTQAQQAERLHQEALTALQAELAGSRQQTREREQRLAQQALALAQAQAEAARLQDELGEARQEARRLQERMAPLNVVNEPSVVRRRRRLQERSKAQAFREFKSRSAGTKSS